MFIPLPDDFKWPSICRLQFVAGGYACFVGWIGSNKTGHFFVNGDGMMTARIDPHVILMRKGFLTLEKMGFPTPMDIMGEDRLIDIQFMSECGAAIDDHGCGPRDWEQIGVLTQLLRTSS